VISAITAVNARQALGEAITFSAVADLTLVVARHGVKRIWVVWHAGLPRLRSVGNDRAERRA
jgi:hypothetical protein